MTQTIPVPAFGGGSLADVLPSVLAGLGVAGESAALEFPVTSRVCVVLVDGLGWNALRALPEEAPFLTSLLGNDGSRAITSVFPTTTPIALTSLGTGLSPGEHGIVGLLLRLPEDGRVVDTLALPAQVDMRALQPRPTAFERAVAAGIEVTRIGPKHFDGAGLSEAGLRGGRYAGAESKGERVDATHDAVRRGQRSLSYVYLGTLDATGHRRGCSSTAWARELTHIDRVVEQIADTLPAGATLLITSDHGMVDVPFENRWDVADTPSLSAGVEVVAGDLRGVHVHARPGAAEDVLEAWRSTLGADFWVFSRDDAIKAGLYGPAVAEHVYHRIGDVVAVARDTSAVVDRRVMSPELLALVGLHGSVTEDELVVPLLIAARL
ncbi:MAG: nucleotide pyrophosphatase/phosphodiesterase family protein [Sporichthyaceae bacterium]